MLKLKIKSPQLFIDFIKRFSSIEKQILIEIENEELKCKHSTIEKHIVKYSSVPLSDIFSWEGDLPSTKIKIGIYNTQKLIDSFKQFSWKDDTFLCIKTIEINKETVAQDLQIVSQELDMSFMCTSLSMFKYQLEDDLVLNKVMNYTGNKLMFSLDKEKQSKISSLCSIDNDDEHIIFESNEKGIFAKGKSFSLGIIDTPSEKIISKITKTLFSMLDKENYNAYVMGNKIIFVSTESKTMTCIANPTE